jgi:hypothetical protein
VTQLCPLSYCKDHSQFSQAAQFVAFTIYYDNYIKERDIDGARTVHDGDSTPCKVMDRKPAQTDYLKLLNWI